jgi:hypothetical protein
MEFLVSLILACGLVPPASHAVAPDTARASSSPTPAVEASSSGADAAPGDGARGVAAGPVQSSLWPGMAPFAPAAGDAEPQRPRAVEMSEAYHVRLTIHYIASFATVPLFVAEYLLGNQLYRNPPGSQATRQAHRTVALGVGALFAVNTVTGVWNLWDSRRQPEGRLLRYLHSGLMLAADAGFVATGMVAPHGRRVFSATPANRSLHRALALSSMGTALVSYAIMLIGRH